MKLALDVKAEAASEIREAHLYYEDRAKGLGTQFRRALNAALELIRQHPHAFPVVEGDVRRVLLRRFPYGIFYQVDGQTVVVIACFHASRDPDAWRRRV